MCRKDRLQIEFSCCTYTINVPQNKKTLGLKLLFCKIFNISTDNIHFTYTAVSDCIEDYTQVTASSCAWNGSHKGLTFTTISFYVCCALFHKFLQNSFFFFLIWQFCTNVEQCFLITYTSYHWGQTVLFGYLDYYNKRKYTLDIRNAPKV